MTKTTKTEAKYRVYTGLQRVTVPNFSDAHASLPLKRKDLWSQICHYFVTLASQNKKSDAWISFY